jgi:hypothetical protein
LIQYFNSITCIGQPFNIYIMSKLILILLSCLLAVSCNPDSSNPATVNGLLDYIKDENIQLKAENEQLKKALADKEAELRDCSRKLAENSRVVYTTSKADQPQTAARTSSIQASDLVGNWTASWVFHSRSDECGVLFSAYTRTCPISISAIGLVIDGQKAALNNREILFEETKDAVPYRYSTLKVKNAKEMEGYVYEYYEKRSGRKFSPVEDKRDRSDCTVTYKVTLTRN